jgi:DNA-directed RNA polymerase specialized sigma24 family protein
MSSTGSITTLFNRLQLGDRDGVQRLWELYFRRLVGLARKKLGDLPRRAVTEEDVALSAFDSFCRAAEEGRFPHLGDRDDLWQLLVLITARKASDLRQHEGRDKRDWRRVHEAAQAEGAESSGPGAFADLFSREPDPAFAAEVAEESRRLLDLLADEELRQIALRKMEGHTNEEIAGQLELALATVERRLRRIRKCWEKELPAEQP